MPKKSKRTTRHRRGEKPASSGDDLQNEASSACGAATTVDAPPPPSSGHPPASACPPDQATVAPPSDGSSTPTGQCQITSSVSHMSVSCNQANAEQGNAIGYGVVAVSGSVATVDGVDSLKVQVAVDAAALKPMAESEITVHCEAGVGQKTCEKDEGSDGGCKLEKCQAASDGAKEEKTTWKRKTVKHSSDVANRRKPPIIGHVSAEDPPKRVLRLFRMGSPFCLMALLECVKSPVFRVVPHEMMQALFPEMVVDYYKKIGVQLKDNASDSDTGTSGPTPCGDGGPHPTGEDGPRGGEEVGGDAEGKKPSEIPEKGNKAK